MKTLIITVMLTIIACAGYAQQKDSMAKFVPPVLKKDGDTATAKFKPPVLKKNSATKKKKDQKVKFKPPVIKKDENHE